MTFLMTKLRKFLFLSLAVFLVNISSVQLAQAQAALSYFKGQHVEPAFEGWSLDNQRIVISELLGKRLLAGDCGFEYAGDLFA